MGTSWQMHRSRHIISTDNHLWRREFNYISDFKSRLLRHQWVTLTYLMLLPECFWQATLSLSPLSWFVPSLEKQQEKQRLIEFGAVKCTSKTSSTPAPPSPPPKTTLYQSKQWRMSKSNKKTVKQIKVKVPSNYLFWQQDYSIYWFCPESINEYCLFLAGENIVHVRMLTLEVCSAANAFRSDTFPVSSQAASS